MTQRASFPAVADDPQRQARLRRLARVRAVLGTLRYRRVRTFCLFIGYARSGSSLVGSLLDAHRHALVAQELDALGFVADGWQRSELFALIEINARQFTRRGREWTGYDYDVPGQWQGRTRELRVIGDKKANRCTTRLMRRPDLLDRLRDRVRVPLRFVHVVRNPFDNITTRLRRQPVKRSLPETIERYFRLARSVDAVRDRVGPHALLDVRHEDLIADPAATLARVCDFVGLDAPDDYLADAASIVAKRPRRTRHQADWPPQLVREVEARCADHSALADYVFDRCPLRSVGVCRSRARRSSLDAVAGSCHDGRRAFGGRGARRVRRTGCRTSSIHSSRCRSVRADPGPTWSATRCANCASATRRVRSSPRATWPGRCSSG